MRRSHVLPEILALDPERDHQRIVRLTGAVDFPWDTQRALELALLRTFCVPASSQLLVATGELVERTQRRYDDTVLLVATFSLHGYDSELGRRAIRRMNQIHRRFDIPAEEYAHTLSLFALEPIRWNRRFGWRPLHPHETRATFVFWREVGRRMGLRDLPASLDEMEAWSRAYEAARFAYHPANRTLFDATVAMFAGWGVPDALPAAPRGALQGALQRVATPALAALLDARARAAFALAPPPTWLERAVTGALRARAAALRRLPARRTPAGVPPLRSHPPGAPPEAAGPPR